MFNGTTITATANRTIPSTGRSSSHRSGRRFPRQPPPRGSNMSIDVLEHTGERMIPQASVPEIFWEHVHRYRFAKRFVRNKRVLDIACGEGYGAFGLLRAGSASVVGVDISEEACANARQKYGIDARCG